MPTITATSHDIQSGNSGVDKDKVKPSIGLIMLNSKEQNEYTNLAKAIDQFREKQSAFAEAVQRAEQHIEVLRTDVRTRLQDLVNADDPIAAYKVIAELQSEIELYEGFVEAASSLLPGMMRGAEPLIERQRAIERKAGRRCDEINRLKDILSKHGAYGLGDTDKSLLTRLEIEQSS